VPRPGAQTKHELADIINVVIEELIRQRFELPAFSTLNRKALTVRIDVNDRYFKTLVDPLPAALIERFDAMLVPTPQQAMSGWQQLKQDPKNRPIRKCDSIWNICNGSRVGRPSYLQWRTSPC